MGTELSLATSVLPSPQTPTHKGARSANGFQYYTHDAARFRYRMFDDAVRRLASTLIGTMLTS